MESDVRRILRQHAAIPNGDQVFTPRGGVSEKGMLAFWSARLITESRVVDGTPYAVKTRRARSAGHFSRP